MKRFPYAGNLQGKMFSSFSQTPTFLFSLKKWGLKGLKIPTLKQASQTFSGQDQKAGFFGSVAHTLSVTTTQFSYWSVKAATDNLWLNGCGCALIKLNLWSPNFDRHINFTGPEK